MKPIPVTLSIIRKSPSRSGGKASAGDALKPEYRQKIFAQDNHTCRCCGFKALKYQDLHFINGIETDTRPENIATVCIFCHQCFNLEQVAAMRSGVLIWLPEMTQTDLHHLTRAIYVARISQGPVADAARRSLDVLMQRRDEARKRLGTDDPQILAAIFRDYISDRAYEARTEKLKGLRLFPLDRRIIREADLEFNQFPQILAYWRSKDGPFGTRIPRQWIDIYRTLHPERAA